MKKNFSKPFGAVVELKQLGLSIVSARVVLPGNICYYDACRISGNIMGRLVTDASIVIHSLDDGTFILCKNVAPGDSRDLSLAACICQESQSFWFPTFLASDNGDECYTTISLDHRFDCRRDYFVNHCRVIDLRGTISVNVDVDDEANEEVDEFDN